MRWRRATPAAALAAVAIVLAAAGCAEDEAAEATPTEPAANLDCPFPLVWNGERYQPGIDLPPSKLGPQLGPGVVLGCGSDEAGFYPDEDVDVHGIEGVAPSVAVAALLEGASRPIVWLAPGYLVTSPRHPLHAAIVESWGLDDGHEGFTCGDRLVTGARALSTPAPGQPLEVEADDPEVEALLTAPSAGRIVSVEPDTVLTGLDRHGVPYVARGDELVLAVRACDGDVSVPALAGIRLLIADGIEGAG